MRSSDAAGLVSNCGRVVCRNEQT